MRMSFGGLAAAAILSFAAPMAQAQVTYVTGKIVLTQGHEAAACRTVQLKQNGTGADFWFRIPNTGQEDGILAVTLTALTTGLTVTVAYDPNLTTGCGGEPKIIFINIQAAA